MIDKDLIEFDSAVEDGVFINSNPEIINYDYRAMEKYCLVKNIELNQLTDAEIQEFRKIKRRAA